MFGSLTTIIATIPALIIGFSFHEFAHAWVADRLGDPTPRSMGRLTLNPLVHLDVFGTLLIFISGFGWAKPVQINPRYFRGNILFNNLLVSIAGPIMNFIVAFISFIISLVLNYYLSGSTWSPIIYQVFLTIVGLNLTLGVFNLIPIPPLDGFAIVRMLIPSRYTKSIIFLERYGFLILMLILFTGGLGLVLDPLVNGIFHIYRSIGVAALSLFLK